MYKPIYKPNDIRKALMGGTIQSAQIRDDGSAYLVITNGARTLCVSTSADPEGNGPGFLYVEESKGKS